jgi:hypothetical protein
MGTAKIVTWACMLCEFKLGSNATAAARKMCQAFGTDVVNERTVHRWYREFQGGDESLEDAPRSGKPTAMDNEALLAAVEADNGQTWEDVAQQFKVSAETLCLRKLSRWVPHELTVAQQAALADACLSLLSRPFLDRFLTCDEKWVLYDTPRRRHHWLAPHEPVPKQPKQPLHPKRVMLCVRWTARCIVHRELPSAGQIISATVYNVSTKNWKLRSLQSWLATELFYCMITQNHMWPRWLVRPLSALVGKLLCNHHSPQIPHHQTVACSIHWTTTFEDDSSEPLTVWKPHWMDCLRPALRSSITMEFMVFHHVGRRSSMATVTIFDATGIIFISVCGVLKCRV